jgi:hypothetical protein
VSVWVWVRGCQLLLLLSASARKAIAYTKSDRKTGAAADGCAHTPAANGKLDQSAAKRQLADNNTSRLPHETTAQCGSDAP